MKENKQSQRTRNLIEQALIKLVLENDFESISVTDICNKALITRATFYKYYEDKYHLMNCVFIEMKEKIFNDSLKHQSFNSSKELYIKIIELCYDFITKNQKKFSMFIKHSLNEKIEFMLLQNINDTIEEFIKKEKDNFKYNVPTEVASKFITGGLAYLLFFIIENKKAYSKKEVMKWVEEMLSNTFNN